MRTLHGLDSGQKKTPLVRRGFGRVPGIRLKVQCDPFTANGYESCPMLSDVSLASVASDSVGILSQPMVNNLMAPDAMWSEKVHCAIPWDSVNISLAAIV